MFNKFTEICFNALVVVLKIEAIFLLAMMIYSVVVIILENI